MFCLNSGPQPSRFSTRPKILQPIVKSFPATLIQTMCVGSSPFPMQWALIYILLEAGQTPQGYSHDNFLWKQKEKTLVKVLQEILKIWRHELAKLKRWVNQVHFAKYTVENKIWKLMVIAITDHPSDQRSDPGGPSFCLELVLPIMPSLPPSLVTIYVAVEF